MTGIYIKKCFDDVIDTSQGAPSARLQRIAHEELGETAAKRQETLAKLKRLLEAEPDLNARLEDEFLLRFLRVRKYDVESALRNLRNYYRNRASSESVYAEFLPSNVLPAARKLYIMMPEKDVLGRLIFVFRPGMWIPEEVPYMDFHRAGLICYEHMACDPVAQTLGIVLLVDFSGFSADKLLSMSISLLRRAFEYLQMRLHGENFEKLHEEIPPEVLPEEFGGHGPAFDFDAFWKEVEANEGDFEVNNCFGYCTNGVDVLPEDCENPQESTSL